MTDPNRPIIDTRTTVTGNQPPIVPPQSDSSGAAAANTTGSGATSSQTTNGVPTAGTSSSSSSSSSTMQGIGSGAISTTIPDEFKGSSNQELIDYLERKIKEDKPLSDADKEKIRRRQKAEGIISGISDAVMSVANLISTHNYAPNMYNPNEGMSAKAKARFDKEKADREAEDDRYFNYAITLGKLRDADKERGLQAWHIEQNLARQDQAFEAGRKDREDDVAFRDKSYDDRLHQWQLEFDRTGEWHKEEMDHWERQFKQSIHQFNVSAANDRARINLEAQRLAHSLKEGQMTFNLGSGKDNVTLTLDKLNAETVSRIYSTLPDDALYNPKTDKDGNVVKDEKGNVVPNYSDPKVKGEPIVQNGMVVGYRPTTETMLIAIGANVDKSPATQNAIKQVAGLETGEKPKGYNY